MSRSDAAGDTVLAAEVAALNERYAPGFAANGHAVEAVRAHLDLLAGIDPHDDRGDFAVV